MPKLLTDILPGVDYTASQPLEGIAIDSVCTDSRRVTAGSLFVCIEGTVADGHAFIATTAAQGAVAIVANRARQATLPQQALPIVWVDDTRKAVGDLAAAFYEHPSRSLTMIGLTGTNGKTTTSFILEAIIREAGSVPGVIGTINYRYGGQEFPAHFTTPEPLELQCLLREMADHGVTHVIMEVSSHALSMHRIRGISFDSVLFTNLTRDHLDFHVDMETYYQAKKLLFSKYLRSNGNGVILVDDDNSTSHPRKSFQRTFESRPRQQSSEEQRSESAKGIGLNAAWNNETETAWGRRLYHEINILGLGHHLLTCGIETDSDITARDCSFSVQKTNAIIMAMGQPLALCSNLVGAFNLKNILGAIGVAIGLGLEPALIARALATPLYVPGRLEAITIVGNQPHPAVFVDYAHTPDALHNVLVTLRQLQPAKLIVVFGCGGDRDPGKRQMMGDIAGRLADTIIITADNSRSESTEAIVAQIEQGVLASGKPMINRLDRSPAGYAIICSRSEAIALAVALAQKSDIVLISGKGHETYQISATGKIFFDDRQEAAKCLSHWSKQGKELERET